MHNNLTPLDNSIINNNKDNLRAKLRAKINNKTEQRSIHSQKVIKEQTEEVKKMIKHPKVNDKILKLYTNALAYNISKSLPNPVEIFNKQENYKAEYYQYILSLLKQIKEQNLDIIHLDKLLDNPYSIYMSSCLECPINPFRKI
jgi:hypothetical protein